LRDRDVTPTPRCNFARLVQAQRKALGRTAGSHEFSQRNALSAEAMHG